MQASSLNGVSSTPPRRFGVQRIVQICRLPQGLGEQRQQCRGSSTHRGERTWRRAPAAPPAGSPPVEHGKEAASPPVGHAKEAAQHLEEGGAGLHGRPADRRRGARRKLPSKDGGSGRPPNPTPPSQQRGESGKGRKANPRRRRRFWRAPPGPTAREGGAARHSAEAAGSTEAVCARHESGRNPRSALCYDTCRYRNIRLFSGLPLHAV